MMTKLTKYSRRILVGLLTLTYILSPNLNAGGSEMDLKEPSDSPAVLRRQFLALHQKVVEGDQHAAMVLRSWRRRGVGDENLYVNLPLLERQAKKSDDAAAWGKVAVGYLLGQGGAEIDHQKARVLLEKASSAGDALSTHNLGVIYSDALGVPRDLEKAKHYYLLEFEQGRSDGLMSLGNFARDAGESDQAVAYYIKAADHGVHECYKRAADLLRNKRQPVEKRKRGLELLEKAAALGDARAAYEAGAAYFDGEDGVPAEQGKAAKYFSQALESKWAGRVHDFFYADNPRERGSEKLPARRRALMSQASSQTLKSEVTGFAEKLERKHQQVLKENDRASKARK